MDKLQQQVGAARWRLNAQQFLERLVWSLLFAYLAAAVAMAVPKIWPIGVDGDVWKWSWLAGAAIVGLLGAVVWTYIVRRNALEAALEIDLRYGLRERVSSSMTLDQDERESTFGKALVTDAVRRVERIDVREKFPIHASWQGLLPVLVAAVAFMVAIFVPDAQPDPTAGQAVASSIDQEKKIVKSTTEELKKKLEERRKEAEEKGLTDASELFKKLEEGTDKIAKKKDAGQKDTLLELNDLAKALKDKVKELGMSEMLKDKLEALKNISKGPADKIADALKDGDLKKAIEEMKNLQQKMANGELSKEEQQALGQQLKEMADKMKQMADARAKAKADLKQQIEQQKAAGNQEAAEKLQRQLDEMEMQNEQMGRMEQMAEQLGEAAEQMQNGNMQEAQQQLNQMTQQLEDLQGQMDQLEMMDEAMEQMMAAKEAMCKACQGEGMDGMGQMGQSRQPGNGMGEGQGRGDRPEEETDTGFYDSQVRADPKKGKGVIVDYVDGKNMAGKTLIEIKEAMSAGSSEDADAIVEKRLSRDHEKNAQQYFDLIRDGG
ncbi:DUF4175 domain-containing protein [Blastopirellula sp. J2-11]|uniref:DUF4175 domain-containing protein n=1 Tax=Blastopirellula sp. J2-11 TaxID=2943192 RepID=UPI0021C8B31F|nr:DUF4175 domain-containing protein [Blastopirellula sp. J2-11]UUO05460.1 DUF4175 domain-containing protein [Blastopirellula sp. J2-11]